MRAVPVHHDGGGYDVVVGSGALEAEALAREVDGRRVFVVTADPVRRLHGDSLARALGHAATTHWLEVPDGEACKTVAVAGSLWERMLSEGGKRDSLVLGFGGGTVGDLAGFAAACFLRGVDLVQVPTTLLAQVDASVGGKTGVDLPAGKNTVGAFHQPRLVVADTGVLSTLGRRQLVSGLVESLKMGAVLDRGLFSLVEDDLDALLGGDRERLETVVARSVEVKGGVVETDPREGGVRRLLNFGHTLGHAIETCLGYRELLHGEAVAHGLRFATDLSRLRGLADDDAGRLVRLLDRLPLPALPDLDPGELLAACARDKKAREGALAWILCAELGRGVVVEDLTEAEVSGILRRFLGGQQRR